MNEITRKQLTPEAAQPKRPPMRIRPMAPILPPSNIQGNALMVVIAIMAFLACLPPGRARFPARSPSRSSPRTGWT